MIDATLIRTTRAKIGCTQSELASKLGTSKSAISRYENGESIPGPVCKLFEQLIAQIENSHPSQDHQPKVASGEGRV